MRNLRTSFNRFCFRHRNKGIPNLMLYITLGAGLVYLLRLFNGSTILYEWLCFDKAKILQGQVWRLLTYLLIYTPGANAFLVLISLYFFYHISRSVEGVMGTLKFNIYFFSGVLLMDIFAMILCPTTVTVLNNYAVKPDLLILFYNNMAYYLHLSIILTFCVTHPDSQFLVLFIIPVKAWFLSIVYLLLVSLEIYVNWILFPHILLPLVGLLNFLLYAGKDVVNLLPPAIRPIPRKKKTSSPDSIQFRPAKKAEPRQEKRAALHCCSLCGRTDISNPELEFRYCSRCHGYHCYCEDHISNHSHIEE